MLFAGSNDGVHRFADLGEEGQSTATRVIDSGPVMRLRSFGELDGLVAATKSGLFYSTDGEDWTDLDVPRESVYSVGVNPAGDVMYAGTRPAHVYVTRTDPRDVSQGEAMEWYQLDGFDDLPSREEWRLPRHENLAQVRDVCTAQGESDRVIAGVEVGGVHVGDDAGETWTERADGVNDDVHELRVLGPGVYVAATGFGLFRTTDAGRSWTRLDENVPQRYFRAVAVVDGTLYAAGAMAHSSTWEDDDADPALYASSDGESLERVEFPYPDETVTGMTGVDGDLVVATHRGNVAVNRPEEWVDVGDLPVPDEPTGTYNPLSWFGS